MRPAPLTLALALALAPAAAHAADAGQDAARSYRIDTAGTTVELEKGGEGRLVLTILPLQGTHVNAEAPLKVALSATPGLKLSRDQLGHKDAQEPGGIAQRFEVPFTATDAGPQEARARLDFYICTEQWCVRQAREVAVAVHVK